MHAFSRLAFALLVLTILIGHEKPARAFTYASAISDGCHERITTATLRTIRGELATAPSIAPSSDEDALIKDLPFGVEPDLQELAGATLLMGVRDNDLKGRGPTELDQLAFVHGDPNHQEEHCLRSASQDEPNGTQEALAACRAFIRGKMVAALAGLDATSTPDPTVRTNLTVSLSIKGKVDASLPLFYVFMGQGLHAMQDSFAHNFRTADRRQPTATMNYIEYVDGDEVESRDGPLHRTGMDACVNIDAFRTFNISVAQDASTELLQAALDPTLSYNQKLDAFDTTLDRYLTYEPGCTVDNHWCNAQEQNYEVARSCNVVAVGRGPGGVLVALGGALGVLALVVRRRRRLVGMVLLLVSFALPRSARAEDEPAAPAPAPEAVPTVSEVKNVKKEEAHERLFGVYAAVSGSITDPALNGQLGVRFRLSKLISLGLDGELNNAFEVNNSKFQVFAFNAYATGIFHYPICFASVNLRTTLQLGTSTLLTALYGAPKGETGIYLGAVPLGLEYKVSKRLYVIFDALGVGLPVPQLKGAPFGYVQYRTAVGLEVTL